MDHNGDEICFTGQIFALDSVVAKPRCQITDKVWYLIVLIPDLCTLTYFYYETHTQKQENNFKTRQTQGIILQNQNKNKEYLNKNVRVGVE